LPPVGTVCEYNWFTGDFWQSCRIVGHDGDVIVVNTLTDVQPKAAYTGVFAPQVRHIKSPKEKDIEKISAVLADRLRGTCLILPQDAETLYDAGCRIIRD